MKDSKKGRPRYDVKNLDAMMELIFFLDGYRVHQYTEIDWIDRMVKDGKLGYRFRVEWDDIRKILTKMATLPKSLAYLVTLAKYQIYLRFIGYVTSTFTFALIGVGLFLFLSRNPTGSTILATIFSYIGIPLITLIIISLAGPPLVANKIFKHLQQYRQENPERFKEFDRRLQRIVQDLLNSVSYYLREMPKPKDKVDESQKIREHPLVEFDRIIRGISRRLRRKKSEDDTERLFDLFNVDYRGIRVVKKPSRLRRFYLVSIET